MRTGVACGTGRVGGMPRTSVPGGVWGGVPPPPPGKATPAHTDSDATTTAAGTAGCHPRRAGAIPLGLNGASLFLRPAGLAVGLAPKERRYGRVRCPIRPRDGFSTPPLWFPRSAAAGPHRIRQVSWAAAVYPGRRPDERVAIAIDR